MRKKILLVITLTCLILNTNGQVWNKLGNGIESWNGPTVYCLKKIDTLLYVGGGFFVLGQKLEKGFAIWNGVSLDSIQSIKGTQWGVPYNIEKFDGKIIIGGGFRRIATTSSGNDTTIVPNTRAIASWDGAEWASVGGGFVDEAVYVLNFKNTLFVGGTFYATPNIIGLNCMARWDGSNWHNVGTGVSGDYRTVRAMAVFNDDLIIGGYFNKAGGIPAFNIAGWDGTQYFDLDTGVLTGNIHALLTDTINNLLFVGADWITHAGGYNGFVVNKNILRWDGYLWDTVGINSGINYGILSLSMYHNELFAGASGITGQITDTILTRFDGYQWHRVEGPLATVLCLEVYNDELYVGGGYYMMTTSGDTAWGVARYYSPPDTTSCLFIQPLIHAMPFGTKEVKDTFYTTPPYHIQFYTNNKYASSWSWDFGDGGTASTREPAHTYAAPGTYNVTLEVIHPHNLSSQVCTLNVAKTITIIDNTAVKETAKDTIEYLGQNIPNPFSNSTSIPYYVPHGSKGVMQVHSAAGALVGEYGLQEGKQMLEVSMKELKAGVYYYSIVIDGMVRDTRKMVVE